MAGDIVPRKKKIAILVNTIAPYRVPLYRRIAEGTEACVFVSGHEGNRESWSGVENDLSPIPVRHSRGVSIPIRVRRTGGVYDQKYLHFPFGAVVDLLSFKPDGIITNEMGLRTIISLLYGALKRRPVWVWWGGTIHTERSIGFLRRTLRRVIARRAPRWISYGYTSTEYLLTLGVPPNRILQIQNCVDESIFTSWSGSITKPHPTPVLLYVGQMIQRKGVDKLLQAAASIQQDGYEFSLVLVGDGPELPRFKAMTRELGLKHVDFLPAHPARAMADVYRNADVFVFPTGEDVWGLVVNEALWSDLPVVSSMYAGCAPELLPGDQIFNPDDMDDFTKVLKRAVTGQITVADTSRMKTCEEVGEMLRNDIHLTLYGEGC